MELDMNMNKLYESIDSIEFNLRDLFTKIQSDSINKFNVIYCIHNNINNKNYIGKSKNFLIRFCHDGKISHLSSYIDYCKNQDYNIILYKAIYKYKSRNFSVKIIESDLDNLNEREKYWIKKFHTCIYDPECWGYNMTWGGEDTSQLNSETSQLKALETKRVNGNGDCMYMCHTSEVAEKIRNTKIKRYGSVYEPMVTEQAQINLRCSMLLNSIEWYLDTLKSDGAISPINFETYWNWSDGYWHLSNFYYHIRSIYRNIHDLRLNSRWTQEMEDIFTELELHPDKYKCI